MTCSLSLYLLYLCHLELTGLQPARGSCDTNHNPAFILLYQPHPLSLPFLLPPCPSFPSLNTHYTLLLTSPPTLACSFFFLQSSPLYLLPTALSSDLASLEPAPSIPSLPPSTAEHPIEQSRKNIYTPLSSAMFDTKKQLKPPQDTSLKPTALLK